ncbi:MAG: 30S ribosomal protein S12 methylthiotransferase RimO [Candidatus Gracilibacteria bacterium]|nr:30S ribosomal protein S12 methylthiotransferase RimO [Candidatus Gracilibacteria bacterium]
MKKYKVKIGIITLGCPKNTADTESILAELPDYYELANVEDAKLILINTCAFLKAARDEVYEILTELHDKKIILAGCLAGQLQKEIFKKYPQLFAVVSGNHYEEMGEIVKEIEKNKRVFAVSKEPVRYIDMKGKILITPRSFAYVKIAEGCDNKCSFCLIPKLKGRYRSRPMVSIITEIKELISLGVKEIILVAQDCGYYGIDLYGKKSLTELLQKISSINKDFWVRVLYVYPERIDDELLNLMAKSTRICKYLDIPLQHGDADILKSMRRPFIVEKTIEKIANIRKIIPIITFRTSLIVGFPGETEKSFKNLEKFIKKIKFDHVGVFEYSKEENTEAGEMPNQISEKTKKLRRKKAMLIQQKISSENAKKSIGTTQKVIIESYDPKKKIYTGRSQRFAPDIDGKIFIKSKIPLELNTFHKVKITKGSQYDCWGETRS